MQQHDRDGARPWQGLPQTSNSAITPVGQLEQVSKMVDGLGSRREGWRRVIFRGGVGLIALAVAVLVFLMIYRILSA